MAGKLLRELWERVLVDDGLLPSEAVRALINSNQTSIRFCLPTQLLGKLTDNTLDALCLQRGDGTDPTRWDPRSFAAHVVVPWNRENQSVLGPSSEPYVSNPLRRARVDTGLDQMADRAEWEALCAVLNDVQTISDPEATRTSLLDTLAAIRDRMRELNFVYVVPERISLGQASALVSRFLSEKSGGDRGLCVAAALFETLKDRLSIFSEIRRGVINATDTALGAVGDLECLGPNGDVLLAVEVKERAINAADVHGAIAKAREFKVREFLFCCEGVSNRDERDIKNLFDAAWASGTSLYVASVLHLMEGVLPILGEKGISTFVVMIGSQLDRFSTQPRHRKAWKAILDQL